MPSRTDSIHITAVNNFPEVQPGDDLPGIITNCILSDKAEISNDDAVVVAQKVVSKAEGRIADLRKVKPSGFSKTVGKEVAKDPRLVEVILSETRKRSDTGECRR